MPNGLLKSLLPLTAAAAALSALYWVLRLPTAAVPLSFYDDGETLYHTLSILSGKLPYRDDCSHHFLGYALEFVLSAKIFGFSPALVRQTAFANQILTGLGVFLCMRFFLPWGGALLAAALTVSAREPWVTGFFVQYQINLLWVWALYGLLGYLAPGAGARRARLGGAAALLGLAFTFDQRSIFLAVLPAAAVGLAVEPRARRIRAAAAAAAGWLAAPALAALYLWRHDLLTPFVEQTMIFPARYRTAGASWSQLWLLHKHLFTETPVLLAAGALGWAALRRSVRRESDPARRAAARLLGFAIWPLAVMPFFGARDYDYYTITWLPYLAMLAALSPTFFERLRPPLRALYRVLLWAPAVFAAAAALMHQDWAAEKGYRGDGLEELIPFLKADLKPDRTLYVWGYRPDIYAYFPRLSPYPFVNSMMIQPDKIGGADAARGARIYPKYEALFLEMIENRPSDYVVTINEDRQYPSPAHEKMMELLARRYDKIFSLDREDFRKLSFRYRVYRRSNDPHSFSGSRQIR